jgi:hypothetical protein
MLRGDRRLAVPQCRELAASARDPFFLDRDARLGARTNCLGGLTRRLDRTFVGREPITAGAELGGAFLPCRDRACIVGATAPEAPVRSSGRPSWSPT